MPFVEPMEVISLWLAVDRSVPENGCLRVIPGTHRMSLQPLRARPDVDSVLESEIAIDDVDEERAVDLVLEPGDVSVHHPNVVHGSSANTGPYRRCGLTVRYIPTTTRIVSQQPWPAAYLLRGEARREVGLASIGDLVTLEDRPEPTTRPSSGR